MSRFTGECGRTHGPPLRWPSFPHRTGGHTVRPDDGRHSRGSGNLFILIIALLLSACTGTEPVKPEIDRTPVVSPAEALKQLVSAQDNFFSMSGRFSMDLEPLVKHGFLNRGTADVIDNVAVFDGWKFERKALPFPDEDVSWCRIARGPKGEVLLGAYTGVWRRLDGRCPVDKKSLPPAKPWVRVD